MIAPRHCGITAVLGLLLLSPWACDDSAPPQPLDDDQRHQTIESEFEATVGAIEEQQAAIAEPIDAARGTVDEAIANARQAHQ